MFEGIVEKASFWVELFSAVWLLEQLDLSDIVVQTSSMSMHEANVVNYWIMSIYIYTLLQLSQVIEKKEKKASI